MKFPEIKTQRLVLDEISLEEKTSIFSLYSNEDVVKYYDLSAFKNIAQAEDIINLMATRFKESSGIRWAIQLKENKKLIGTCGFNSWNHAFHSTVIGYDINHEYWGNGFVTEALSHMINKAFKGELSCKSINRIQADTMPENLASEKALKKLGFQEEGTRRQAGFWKNEHHDLKCFSLLREEYRYSSS